jgi:preprotein translocase subunit SecA
MRPFDVQVAALALDDGRIVEMHRRGGRPRRGHAGAAAPLTGRVCCLTFNDYLARRDTE